MLGLESKPRKKSVRLSPSDQDLLLAAYVEGDKIEVLAGRFNVSLTYPSILARRRGLPRRVFRSVCPHCNQPLTRAS